MERVFPPPLVFARVLLIPALLSLLLLLVVAMNKQFGCEDCILDIAVAAVGRLENDARDGPSIVVALLKPWASSNLDVIKKRRSMKVLNLECA